jgi:hypothetical protein
MESDQTAIGKTLSGMEVITGIPALNGGEPDVKSDLELSDLKKHP